MTYFKKMQLLFLAYKDLTSLHILPLIPHFSHSVPYITHPSIQCRRLSERLEKGTSIGYRTASVRLREIPEMVEITAQSPKARGRYYQPQRIFPVTPQKP